MSKLEQFKDYHARPEVDTPRTSVIAVANSALIVEDDLELAKSAGARPRP